MINSFVNRHVGIKEHEISEMLSEIGNNSVQELINQTIPKSILKQDELKVGDALNESDYLNHLNGIASKNKLFDNYIGQGFYGTNVPNVIKRNILCNV